MANYHINLTNGQPLFGVGGLSPTVIDTSATSLNMIGQNSPNYGTALNTNFVRLLENFSFGSPPSPALAGQLWWDSTNNILRVYTGYNWKISTGATVAPLASPPTDRSPLGGDLWYVQDQDLLKIWTGLANGGDGDGWKTVGSTIPALVNTKIVAAFMFGADGTQHQVLQVKIARDDTVYAVFSADTFYQTAVSGFTTIKPGLNFNTVANWKLSSQDVGASAGSVVERDGTGAINATTFNGTTLNATTVIASSVTGSFFGPLTGNVSATSVTTGGVVSSGTISGTGISASAGFTGTLLTAAQPNITSVGIINNLRGSGTTTLTGTATLNGVAIATVGGTVSFTSIDNTPIGQLVPAAGSFTTLSATSGITGTLQTASQTNITGVGTITTGTWRGSVVGPTWGGTGVNNGSNTLTLASSYTLNQSVASGASPTFVGTNFSSIPNGALINNSITINGTPVSLGGSYTSPTGVSSLVAGTGVSVSSATGAVTVSIGQAIGTTSNPTFSGLTVNGTITATQNIIAYSASDIKFKENVRPIPNALEIVAGIGGKLFDWTDEYVAEAGGEDGYFIQKSDFGVVAQDVQKWFPVAVRTRKDGSLAVDYEKLSALSFAAFTELVPEIAALRAELNELKSKIK